MNTIAWLLLLATLLPYVAAIAAKAGGKGFDNNQPRVWLQQLQGWRSRANAAQQNLFEGLPFFYAAALFALWRGVEPAVIAPWMVAWILVRLLYIGAYVAGRGTVRSLLWGVALALNIGILFAGL